MRQKGWFLVLFREPFFWSAILWIELYVIQVREIRGEEYEGDREYNRDMRPLQPLRILVMVGDLKIYDEKTPNSRTVGTLS